MTKSIIVARSVNHVIGKKGQLPWHMPRDMQHFMQTTYGHHVIMGRNTFESLPRALTGRNIIVLSHNTAYQAEDCAVVSDLKTALELATKANETEVFIAGGLAVYQEALTWADKIYLTLIETEIEGDTFFPILKDYEWKEVSRCSYPPDAKHAYSYDFVELVRRI